MDKAEKKRLKAQSKAAKKQAKAIVKQVGEKLKTETTGAAKPTAPPKVPTATAESSPAVRFAEAVRGIIYLIFAVSLVLAVILGQKGLIVSLDDIIGSLLLIRIGQIILVVIALALFIYGLKHLRLVK
ncbi:DUF1206 domain-containing protein [Planctomycetota bacterium]